MTIAVLLLGAGCAPGTQDDVTSIILAILASSNPDSGPNGSDYSGNRVWIQDAYLKPSNTGAEDRFGLFLALNGDYAVVGSVFEDNSSTNINNTDNASITDSGIAADSGAVYIFKRDSSTDEWSQDAYLKPSNTGIGDYFGISVSISGDYVIVGSYYEDNGATSINNTDNAPTSDTGTAYQSGAAFIFKRDNSTGEWFQDAYLKPTNTETNDGFGNSVSISGDYAIVGSYYEDNSSTNINNTDNASITDEGTASGSGAAFIFKRDSSTGEWSQDAYLKASNAGDDDLFSYNVFISGDYAIVGAHNEDNSSTTINNTDNASITDEGTASGSGAAYIFKRDSSTGEWSQDAYLKASNAGSSDEFGQSVSISGDYAVVGAVGEDNSSTTINNTDNASITDEGTASGSGAAYIFKRDSSTGEWFQDAYLKSPYGKVSDSFGKSVAIDGSTVMVGASNASTGGAVCFFKLDDSTGEWALNDYVESSNAEYGDHFGTYVSINGDYAIVGADSEDNSSTNIDNTDGASITDEGFAYNSGAVYIFKRN